MVTNSRRGCWKKAQHSYYPWLGGLIFAFVRDFGSTVPGRGYRALGLVSRSTMIAIAAGKRGARVIALNNYTGKDVWCALPSDNSEPRYFQPILIHHGHAHWWCGTRPRLNRSI